MDYDYLCTLRDKEENLLFPAAHTHLRDWLGNGSFEGFMYPLHLYIMLMYPLLYLREVMYPLHLYTAHCSLHYVPTHYTEL